MTLPRGIFATSPKSKLAGRRYEKKIRKSEKKVACGVAGKRRRKNPETLPNAQVAEASEARDNPIVDRG